MSKDKRCREKRKLKEIETEQNLETALQKIKQLETILARTNADNEKLQTKNVQLLANFAQAEKEKNDLCTLNVQLQQKLDFTQQNLHAAKLFINMWQGQAYSSIETMP